MIKKPGVADNKSYHDMYHFNDNFFDTLDRPSLNVDPDINTTIKKNTETSNVEIEKDEVVLQPDLSALFKAKGKKHSGGGIDVYLKPGSFVFSDDKSLAIGKRENELFEFKEGGEYKKDKYTPANVLKRNIDVEHYNRLVANLADPKKDDLTKKSSAMMLEKYIATLGNIAYLQEKKKGFPQGLPEFSMGTAPVYNEDVKDEVDEQKQYAKYGGEIMQAGGRLDRYIGKRPPYPTTWKNYYDKNQKQQYTAPDWINPTEFYGTPGVVDYMKTLDVIPGVDNDLRKPDDAWWGYRHQAALRKFFRGPLTPPDIAKIPDLSTGPMPIPQNRSLQPNAPGPQVPGIEPVASKPKTFDWEFSPWQKISQGYNALKYATAKRYMPYRSQYTFTPAEPALLNEQQAVGSATALANSQINSLNTLNPILRDAQGASAYGQYLDKIPELGLQAQNQNVGIKNQFRMYNNQGYNNVNAQNVQADQNYYQQSVVARQNFDNLKSYLGDQYMNNVLRDVETNQSLAYNLATQNNPAWGYDFRTGNFYRNPKEILDVQGNGAQEELKGLMATIDQIGDPYQKAQALTKLYGLKIFGPAIQQSGMKRGGYKNPYL